MRFPHFGDVVTVSEEGWDGVFAQNHMGKQCSPSFTTPTGIPATLHKNCLLVYDETQQDEDGEELLLKEVYSGTHQIRDLWIVATRGPFNGIYCVVWCEEKGVAMIGTQYEIGYNALSHMHTVLGATSGPPGNRKFMLTVPPWARKLTWEFKP